MGRFPPSIMESPADTAKLAVFAEFAVFAVCAVIPVSADPSPTNEVAFTLPFTAWLPLKMLPMSSRA